MDCFNTPETKRTINDRNAKICSLNFKECGYKLEHILNIPHTEIVNKGMELTEMEIIEKFEIDNLEKISFDETKRNQRTPNLNEDSINSVNWLHLCHICGKEHDNLIPVKNNDVDIIQIINKFLSIPLDYFDENTWIICISCKDFLVTLVTFSTHFSRVQQMFLEMELLSNLNAQISLTELQLKYGINKNFKVEKYYIDDDETEDMGDSYDFLEINNKLEKEIIVSDIQNSKEKTNPSNTMQINNYNLEHVVEHLYFKDESLSLDFSNDANNELENVRNDINGQIENDEDINDTFLNDESNELQNVRNDINVQIENDEDINDTFSNDGSDHLQNVRNDANVQIENDEDIYDTNDQSNQLENVRNDINLQRENDKNINDTDFEFDLEDKNEFKPNQFKQRKFIHCELCQRIFNRKKKFESHLRTEHNIKNYKHSCKLCNKKFSTLNTLKKHQRLHLPQEEKEKLLLPCSFCDQKFVKNSTLQDHIITRHSDSKNYICEICGKLFSTSTSLSAHRNAHRVRDHKDITGGSCPICNKICRNQIALKAHILTHNPPSIKCSVCSALLKNNTVLKYHMMIHTGANPHSCSFCGKGFKFKINYKLHMIKHTDLKPFVCRFCNQAFTSPYSCKKHEKRFHIKECLNEINEKPIADQYDLPTTEQLELLLVNKKLNK